MSTKLSETGQAVMELVLQVLLHRFPNLDRKEIGKMFGLKDIRKSKVWKEAYRLGIENGEKNARKNLILKCRLKGMDVKEIADLFAMSMREVRRFAKVR